MREETISINGVLYNTKTGQAVKKPAPAKIATKAPLKKVAVRQPKRIIVDTVQKPSKHKPAPSKTLNRQIVKKPVATNPRAQSSPIKPTTKRQSLAKTPELKARTKSIVAQSPSQIMSRGIKRPKSTTIPPTSKKSDNSNIPQKENKKRKKIVSIVIGASIVGIIAGVMLAYFFLPSFSVWIASVRANVNASLPTYTPAGYKVAGTADSNPGIVTINYHSDATNNNYVLTQANSNWDSKGVLENKVKPLGGSYQTLSQKGLTIYRYTTGAVWVNGGIIYTITDEGKLSNEQILQIVDGI